ncbi:hypothetical protein QTP70_006478 [Hemibagrus guttatus]|uniref:Uncharacterized protein n=1 Tax=Hemibagrus guttatus TaxID=175788 RepID=A0AAE0QGK2_9TELE|nr:hypothetical protein QTP70_006478 [Hemibagrus guttatus]
MHVPCSSALSAEHTHWPSHTIREGSGLGEVHSTHLHFPQLSQISWCDDDEEDDEEDEDNNDSPFDFACFDINRVSEGGNKGRKGASCDLGCVLTTWRKGGELPEDGEKPPVLLLP